MSLKKLIEIGYPAVEFKLHTLRAGGATAVANAGVLDCFFERHGRWRSDNAKDGYIDDSAERRLSLSKSIGLYPFVLTLGKSVASFDYRYATGPGKSGHICTSTGLHFLSVRESYTHALPRNTK